MTMTRNSKKKAGRPKGRKTLFPGIKAFAAGLGVTPLHVHQVLTGKRQSGRVTRAWHEHNTI
jgi:hypothetical protein